MFFKTFFSFSDLTTLHYTPIFFYQRHPGAKKQIGGYMRKHQKAELNELIENVKAELKNAHYSDRTVRRFAGVWNRLASYMEKGGRTVYTVKIGMDFLEAEYGITVYTAYDKLTRTDKRHIRAVNILSDFLLHGIIFSRKRQGGQAGAFEQKPTVMKYQAVLKLYI